ncbi:MAG TPA: lytic transglycosylase domain-containing protein [Ktedonobacteraceae bacterium]
MESKPTLSVGSIVGLSAIVLVLWMGMQAMGNNSKLQTGINYLKTGQTSLDYRSLAREDATDNGISADLFERQINQESGFNSNAISPAGAIGIAQIMPSTAAGWNVDPHDPVASLSAAASAMARYYTTYQSYPKALAAYNAGTTTLDTDIAEYGTDWQVHLPLETQNYITAIMGVQS